MTGDTDSSEVFSKLRRQAEAVLKECGGPPGDIGTADISRLIHELEVRQIELDLQNEDLRNTTKDLQSARDEYCELYESAPAGYVTLDKDGIIKRVNAAAVDLFQYAPQDLIGRKFDLFLHLDDLPVYYKGMKNISRRDCRGNQDSIDVRLSMKAGEIRYVRLQFCAQYKEKDAFSGWRLAVIDIPPQKKAEQELRRAHDDLENQVSERTAELSEKNLKLDHLNKNLVEEQKRRNYLSKKLVEILEKERREMAAALHDEIGQAMAKINMDLDFLKDRLKAPPCDFINEVKAIQERVKSSRDFIKNLSRSYRPSVLDNIGLVPSIESMCDDIDESYPVNCHLFTKDIPEKINDEKALAVYRIIQEAVTNALKYSGAKNIFVNLIQKDGSIMLTIEDDGAGFDYAALSNQKDGKEKLGLLIMNERAVHADGEFRIESQVGKGTQVFVEIPL